jgi:hypothetical protein
MRRLTSLTLVLACSSVAPLATVACNALLETPDDVLRDASVSDGAGDHAILADALDDQTATMDSSGDASGDRVEAVDTAADITDSGPDGADSGPGVTDSGPDAADSGPSVTDSAPDAPVDAGPDTDGAAIVCADSCPDGGCVLSTCPVRIAGQLGRTVGVFADPGATGYVFFADFDSAVVYHYEKTSGTLGSFSPSSSSPVQIVANATDVFWTVWNHRVSWGVKGAWTSGEVLDTSYGVTWNVPWTMGIDDDFIYWCDRYTSDLWRMDLGLKTPQRLYAELLPDGAPSPDQQYGNIAVDPGAGDGGFVFFTAENEVQRVNKDGTGLVAFVPVLGHPLIGIHGGYLYWVDAAGALRRAPEGAVPSCDAGACGQVVVPPGTPGVAGPTAFDDTYAYWRFDDGSNQSILARARLDGHSTDIEVLVRHTAINSVAVDDVAIYYTTGNDNGVDNTGSFWRLAK